MDNNKISIKEFLATWVAIDPNAPTDEDWDYAEKLLDGENFINIPKDTKVDPDILQMYKIFKRL